MLTSYTRYTEEYLVGSECDIDVVPLEGFGYRLESYRRVILGSSGDYLVLASSGSELDHHVPVDLVAPCCAGRLGIQGCARSHFEKDSGCWTVTIS